MLTTLTLTAAVKERARALGFDDVAVGPADAPVHADAFSRWLDAGFAGSMSYLERTRAERANPALLLPGARSVIAVALSYGPRSAARGNWRRVARYARGRDYHDVIRPRLAALVDFLREAAGPDVRSRAAVDTSAVLERDLAARAGLGWIGRNTNLLSERLGSYFFIGIVLTTAALHADTAAADRCGTCTACLDACPTDAFVAPYVLDARRCISYLTIEHRGEIEGALRAAVGEWLFGCDVCQEVCPWNRKAPPTRAQAFEPEADLPDAESILALDEQGFRARFRRSPLWRAKRAGLARNAALVLARREDASSESALRTSLSDPDPVVRDAAAWALRRRRAPANAEPR